ncbi:MAG TPA: hypothetical protein PK760_15715, partial [Flavobacteriales bacterium]|nr:hypothetical protein [Flavobacteriales bacterium]
DALQGNMRPVLDSMEQLNDASLPIKQQQMKHQLLARFRTQDEAYAYPTTDTTLIDVLNIYQRYWTDALLDGDVKEHDTGLAFRVGEHLRTHVPALRTKKPSWLMKHWKEELEKELKAHGCYAAIGKTGQFYDLLLHMRESEVNYPVTTPEDTIDVKVVFMDSVISNGWEGYATLDTYYPGGWATSDALYCAHDSYDLASEDFRISYLKHEGKHFADYKRFPKLESPDLEYRAKLVELSAAESSLPGLIQFFLQNSAYDATNPHAYANFCVMRDLSRALFNKEREEDVEAWKKLPLERIQQASTALLLKNTGELEAAGAGSVKTFIR